MLQSTEHIREFDPESIEHNKHESVEHNKTFLSIQQLPFTSEQNFLFWEEEDHEGLAWQGPCGLRKLQVCLCLVRQDLDVHSLCRLGGVEVHLQHNQIFAKTKYSIG